MRTSLAGRLLAVALAAVVAAAAAAWGAAALEAPPGAVLAASLAAGVLAALPAFTLAWRPVRRLLAALTDGVRSFHESEFTFRVAVPEAPELRELVQLFNALGEALRSERGGIVQRELLLDTLLQGAPMAILLVDDRGRVVLANASARSLLGSPRSPVGRPLVEATREAPAFLREPLLAGVEGVVSLARSGSAGDEETYRLLARDFSLDTRRHRLLVVERITPEMRRAEADAWKRVVAVMSHELNNTLAPLSSLVHSARTVVSRGDPGGRLSGILDGIGERVAHLAGFLEGYSRTARLPPPRRERVAWGTLLDEVRALYPFRFEGRLPEREAFVDPAQMTQVLVNLLKNAHEAGGAGDEVAVRIAEGPDRAVWIHVLDRGAGMNDEERRRALLPFATSKPGGTGLGLPLAAEIVAAHGGTLRIAAREGGGTAVSFGLPAVYS